MESNRWGWSRGPSQEEQDEEIDRNFEDEEYIKDE